MCPMTDIAVRNLSEQDWQDYRETRLAALRESPEAFVATLEQEQDYPEERWRERMNRARRLLAESDGAAVGVVSIGVLDDAENTAELFGLWVDPNWRGRGVAAKLVTAGAAEAAQDGFGQLAYWVGTDNGRGVAFASGFGFRPTGRRRPMRVQNGDGDEEEIAMVLALGEDRA